jgi:hypothetical protein
MKIKYLKPCYSRDAYSVDRNGKRWNLFCFRRGIASEFIHHLPKLLATTKNRRVVLYVRASSAWQKENGNLDEAKQEALRQLKALGCTVIAVFSEVANSSIDGLYRFAFFKAIACAKRHGAILVSPSRDRLLRHEFFKKTNRTELPMISEYRLLRFWTSGIHVATLLHPDKPARGLQIKRGQRAKGNRVGRPRWEQVGPGWMKRRMQAYLVWAESLREEGWPYHKIADYFKRARAGYRTPTAMTVWNWLNRPKQRI